MPREGRSEQPPDAAASPREYFRVTPHAFIAKWRDATLKERSAAQEHFLDLCRLLDEPTPAEADPTGATYCFERGARKDTGGDGWADVWKRHCFAWEYKGQRANLDAAFAQLRQYTLALENPPLLIAEQPDRTLAELKDTLGTPASLATIWRAVAALDVTVKKNGPALRTRST